MMRSLAASPHAVSLRCLCAAPCVCVCVLRFAKLDDLVRKIVTVKNYVDDDVRFRPARELLLLNAFADLSRFSFLSHLQFSL